MINQNPRAKLAAQVQSDKSTTEAHANKKSNIGNPKIELPKDPTPKPPPAKGFYGYLKDKVADGVQSVKDAAFDYAIGKAEDKMTTVMNPSDQPPKKLNNTPNAGATPNARRPTPNVPKMGARPRPNTPKFKR